MCVLGLVVSGSCWEGYQDGRDPQSEELCNRSARPRYRYVGHRQSQGKVIQVGEESVVRITSHAGQLLLSLNEVTFPRNVDDAEPLQTSMVQTHFTRLINVSRCETVGYRPTRRFLSQRRKVWILSTVKQQTQGRKTR